MGPFTSPHQKSHSIPNSGYSQPWGGYVDVNWGYGKAYGQWNHPCIITPYTPNSSVGIWVGLDGDGNEGGSGNLVQEGTYANIDSSNHISNWAFIEDYPNDLHAVNAFPVNCGDHMYAYSWQENLNGSPYKAHMYVQDLSSGHYYNAYNTSAFSNGSTAEWIVEQSTAHLANFNYVAWHNCYVVLYNGSTYAADNRLNQMYVVAQPSGGSELDETYSTSLNHDSSTNTSFFNIYWEGSV